MGMRNASDSSCSPRQLFVAVTATGASPTFNLEVGATGFQNDGARLLSVAVTAFFGICSLFLFY
jgi:hypothetical protein